ncbi:Rtt106-domain-containing protein [Patellaria atrata CBS 101060]|uniref:Rtt106-domain-containing protein n=1 Tax=Patellaria atrata CBS 101060 TaxID=1346257 RepID=A0A9P4SDZ7_9PEZI|nr:Rtt106-domain-containing protein [Patellaria atrata CBS 101060]
MSSLKLPVEISDAFSDPKYPITPLLTDISTHIIGIKRSSTSIALPSHDAPASKKRKLDNGTATNGSSSEAWRVQSAAATYSVPDASFSMPQRKKLHLQLIGGKGGGLRAQSSSGEIEFGVSWKDIDQVFCLPVPEKAKRQHNFVIIPRGGDGITPPPADSSAPEPIVWTYDEPSGKALKEGEDPSPAKVGQALNNHLHNFGKEVIFPSASDFASAIPQSHRKGEKAFHVKAFRGSKEGYLFFLSSGILFGFKKPLAFFPPESISSVSYTSILQRTFNLVISIQEPEQDIEFSMIDQIDYAGIDSYVKQRRLNDASLAATRKAKKYNVNAPKGEEEQAAEDEDGEGELQKAERMLQDEEDEEEEDYQPDDESDGGSPSESSGDEDRGEEMEDVEEDDDEDEEEGDLLEKELGSEAEDVESDGMR